MRLNTCIKCVSPVLLLAVSGCGASAPAVYQRGTAVAPPPAPARPGVGAPVVGQPGQRQDLPRGTDTRVLPPTREPGIWASDKPKGKDKPASKDLPPGTPNYSFKISRECGREQMIIQDMFAEEMKKLPTMLEIRCYHFSLSALCTNAEADALRRNPELAKHKRWKDMKAPMRASYMNSLAPAICDDRGLTSAVRDLVRRAAQQFKNITGIPQ